MLFFLLQQQKNDCNAETNSDPLIANPYSTSKTLFLDKGSNSIEDFAQTIGSYNYLTPKCHKMDIKKQECKMETQMLMKIDSEKNNGLCKERRSSQDYSLSYSNDGKVSDLTELNLDKCPVCGDNATKYVHYGGRSCQPCRAFFRRSAKRFSRSVR